MRRGNIYLSQKTQQNKIIGRETNQFINFKSPEKQTSYTIFYNIENKS